jgi:4-amino-4-deoxy-L-arabinose transferase-like glycosyltransferase
MERGFFELSSRPATGGSPFFQILSTPRFQFAVLLVLTTFLCTIKLDDGGLAAFDECFYAQKAKEMVVSGDWLTQRLAGKPDHLNPWLHMWTIAASYKLFGVSDWSARFPTSVETVAIVLLTYLLAQWMLGAPFFPLLSASMLIGNDFFYRFARKAQMDHLVTLLFLAAVVMYLLGRKGSRWWFLGMGVSIGLAVLTKSILGFFPLIVILLHALAARDWNALRQPLFILSVVAAIVIGSTWYLYEYVNFRDDFVRYHFRWLIVSASTVGEASAGALSGAGLVSKALHNLYAFVRDVHVWLVLGAAGLVLMRVRRPGPTGPERVGTEWWTLLAIWFLVPTAVMLAGGQFKGWYLMPELVPIAILGAFFFYWLFPAPQRLRWVGIAALSLLALHLSILVITPLFSLDVKHEIRHPGIRKLATKVRLLGLEPGKRVVHFPATREIAERHGMADGLYSYYSVALPWLFYSDHPLFERSSPASLEETRRYLDEDDGICLTTDEGFDVISEHGALPYEMAGRARDKSVTYVICCSRRNFLRWRVRLETDLSRPPLYDLRQY